MSVPKEYIDAVKRYWRTSIKMILHYFWPILFKNKWTEITVEELYERVNSDDPPLLIDVRTVSEFNGTYENSRYGHIPDARSIPMLELESALESLESYKEKEIVTMCPGGGLSLVAVEVLTDAGFMNVKSLKGGTDEWYEKRYPTTTAA
jgi:rhodanese-related sulfurtransferase